MDAHPDKFIMHKKNNNVTINFITKPSMVNIFLKIKIINTLTVGFAELKFKSSIKKNENNFFEGGNN